MRAIAVVLLMGCGFHYSSSTTRGTACADASGVFCDKFISCGLIASTQRVDCTTAFQMGCCEQQSACGGPVTNAEGAATCLNRIPGESCATFGSPPNVSLPAYCQQMF
jgi:hypothetical protein